MKQTGRRFLAVILVFCLALALPLGASAAFDSFEDVLPPDRTEAPWYSEAVYGLYEVGVLSGAPHFLPDRAVTREEFVTMLGRVAQKAGKDLERDQNGEALWLELAGISDYARPYFNWAVINGVLKGDKNGLAPQRTMTRQEMAVILLRFANYFGLPLSEINDERDFNLICDKDQISPWAAQDMRTAYLTGLVNGSYRFAGGVYDPATDIHACSYLWYLDPGMTVTRAQAAQAVTNYLQRSGLELPAIG